jgi:hypothetical protein
MNQKTLSLGLASMLACVGTATAGDVLIINGASGTSEPNTTAGITGNLQNLLTLAGNTVTVSDAIPATLSPYSQVWDIRFSSIYALSTADIDGYVSYMSAGGGMFVMGENSYFMDRNNSVLALIDSAGGGSLSFDGSLSQTQDVLPPFTGPNSLTQITYAAPGGAAGIAGAPGTGEWITKDPFSESGTGLAYGKGDLANAMDGALTVIFDVNFMQNLYDPANSQALTKNLIKFVETKGVPTVPETTSTLFLAGMAITGLGMVRRFVIR